MSTTASSEDVGLPDGPPAGPPAGAPAPPAFHGPGELAAPKNADVWTGLNYSALNGYRELEMDVYVPVERSAPVACIVWIHGGAWLFGARKFPPDAWPAGLLFQSIIDAGIAVATIDYRHSREAPFPAQLHDAKAAVRYLRRFSAELEIDPDRIGVWGESAGGHLAALLALTGNTPELEGTDGVTGPSSEVAAVVDFYGVSNLATMPSIMDSFPPEWIEELKAAAGGLPPEPMDIFLNGSPLPEEDRARLASPVTHVTAAAPPFLLIHGEADRVVPFEQSVELQRRLVEAGVRAELVAVPGADHVFLGADPVPLIDQAVAFFAEYL
jgi:acetyl esterase/lipase